MITLSQINQYAMDNNIGDDVDIFTILSRMQLEVKGTIKDISPKVAPSTPSVVYKDLSSLIEYTTQDVLDLFST